MAADNPLCSASAGRAIRSPERAIKVISVGQGVTQVQIGCSPCSDPLIVRPYCAAAVSYIWKQTWHLTPRKLRAMPGWMPVKLLN